MNQKFRLMQLPAALLSMLLSQSLYASDDTSVKEQKTSSHKRLHDSPPADDDQPKSKKRKETHEYTMDAVEPATESSALSQAPRILTCHKVKSSALQKWQSDVERVTTPSYAPELSQWVLSRRLHQLPQDIDHDSFKKVLREDFDYLDVWLSITSNAVFDLEDYRLVVNHTNLDTHGYYHSVFDLFLKDAPHKLWIEGTMSVSDIKFEALSVRDAYDLHYSFRVLIDELFPGGLLNTHFSGKA